MTIALTCIALFSGAALAQNTTGPSITLYRSDNAALYTSSGQGDVDGGYAVIREQRMLTLRSGTHDLVLDNLPDQVDAEAMALGFPGGDAQVLSQRLLLAQGNDAALAGLVGHQVHVLGSNGTTLADGTLLRAGDGLLVHGTLGTTLVRHYAAVRTDGGSFPTGSRLELRVDARHGGQARAILSYPTSGLGWRAAYVATLMPGNTCRMRFESRASIANRSGRNWNDTHLTLIAGEPNFARNSGPRPMMMQAKANFAAAQAMPQQSQLADYRSFTLPGRVNLPDGSVSQVPLYTDHTIGCERTALYENGGSWTPPQPMLNRDYGSGGGNTIIDTLKWKAFDSLPAGYLRVLTADRNGVPQFIGEGRLGDTPKGSEAAITLGTTFDLRAERERTAFHVDAAGRTLDEAFRITLTNAGDASRMVTVREHPNRWREWTLASSSQAPSRQTTNLLEFRVAVPAHGKAVLNYAVRYHWSADVQPRP